VKLLNSNRSNILCAALFALSYGGCIRTFTAPEGAVSQNYLVVEGFINAGNDSTYFTLSRSNSLSDSQIVKYESGASVIIEGTNSTTYPLTEFSPGEYSCAPFGAVGNTRYSLHIVTSSGDQYISDDVTPLFTPPIDSVSWANTPGGVTIYVNTHGDNNTSRYYHWTYNETFEIQSTFASIYYYDTVSGYPKPRTDFEAHHTCWRTEYPTNILLGSTTGLTNNTIYQLPINFLSDSSWKLKIEYSILVRQQSIDSNTYSFFQLLHNNNDVSGSIFDAQPTAVASNIHSVNHPSETVIGYVYATSTSEQRIFINNFQVPEWYPEGNSCYEFMLDFPVDDKLLQSEAIIITAMDTGGSYLATKPVCGDCTLSGSNVKPAYWPPQ
jgi:Domain of unknown function (DUF4249)